MDWRHKRRSAPDSRERIPSPEGGSEGSDGDVWWWVPTVRTTLEQMVGVRRSWWESEPHLLQASPGTCGRHEQEVNAVSSHHYT